MKGDTFVADKKNKIITKSKYIKNHDLVWYSDADVSSKKKEQNTEIHQNISSADVMRAPSSKYVRVKKSDVIYQNFDVHNPILSFCLVVGAFFIYFIAYSGAGAKYGGLINLSIAIALPLIALFSRKDIYYSAEMKKAFIAFAVMAALMFISYTKTFDYDSYIRLLLLFSVPITASYLGYNERGLKYISYANTAIGVAIVVDFAAGGITGGWNTNSVGSIAMYGIAWLIFTGYEKQRWRLFTEIAIFAFSFVRLEVTQCRSSMIGLTFLVVFHYFIPIKLLTKKVVYRIIYWCVLCFPQFITYFLVWLHKSEFALNADKWINEYTDKSLFSGREEIWYSLLYDKVDDRFFGEGASYWYNCHSVFMYMHCSVGIIGFIAYIIFLAFIFEFLFKHIDDYTVKCSFISFSAIYLTGAFEEILIKPSILCLVFYMTLAIGVGRACMLDRNSEIQTSQKEENGDV